jgi:hypothetical protein
VNLGGGLGRRVLGAIRLGGETGIGRCKGKGKGKIGIGQSAEGGVEQGVELSELILEPQQERRPGFGSEEGVWDFFYPGQGEGEGLWVWAAGRG